MTTLQSYLAIIILQFTCLYVGYSISPLTGILLFGILVLGLTRWDQYLVNNKNHHPKSHITLKKRKQLL